MRRWLIGLVLLTSACLPRGDVVSLTDEQWESYYLDLDVRASLFFCGVRAPGRNCGLEPGLLGLAELRARVTFEEVPVAETCYHKPGSHSLIIVPADKWKSGCVPHELGHAWLHAINHPCASVFEHKHKDGTPVTAQECSR